jgi:hypothetical protein
MTGVPHHFVCHGDHGEAVPLAFEMQLADVHAVAELAGVSSTFHLNGTEQALLGGITYTAAYQAQLEERVVVREGDYGLNDVREECGVDCGLVFDVPVLDAPDVCSTMARHSGERRQTSW